MPKMTKSEAKLLLARTLAGGGSSPNGDIDPGIATMLSQSREYQKKQPSAPPTPAPQLAAHRATPATDRIAEVKRLMELDPSLSLTDAVDAYEKLSRVGK